MAKTQKRMKIKRFDSTEVEARWRDIVELKRPFERKGFMCYKPYSVLKAAMANGSLLAAYDVDDLVGYIWIENLKKKDVSRIKEIVSTMKGVGRELVDYVIRNDIVKNSVFEVHVMSNNPNAIGFYNHMGFEETERREKGDKFVLTLTYKPHGRLSNI